MCSVPGMDHLMNVPKRNTLFLPESLVTFNPHVKVHEAKALDVNAVGLTAIADALIATEGITKQKGHVSSEAPPDPGSYDHTHREPHPEHQLTDSDAVSPPAPEEMSGTLGVGSPIQVPAIDGTIKYGTIKWIGFVPNIQERIAGLEMVKIPFLYYYMH